MGYFAKNLQEESLREIARQMGVANRIELLRELHNVGAISDEEFAEKLKTLLKIT